MYKRQSQRSMILEQMEHQAGEAPVWMRIHLLSFCMKVSKTPAYTQELLQTVLDADWNEMCIRDRVMPQAVKASIISCLAKAGESKNKIRIKSSV